jgi:alanine racemase
MQKSERENFRTWIEIDSRAAKKNYDTFRKLIGRGVKLWAVVKSNAYGHGLFAFSGLADRLGVDGFCVDSLVEGIALRGKGIKKPILVLGPTLAARYGEATKNKITVSISNFEALRALVKIRQAPEFHIKIDTGMHRQGFYIEDVPKVIKIISIHKNIKNKLTGIFTHFASAKDINYPSYTERQFAQFEEASELFKKAGFKNLTRHVAATGGTLIDSKYHVDAVRVGIGLHGLWPSKELEMQLGKKIKLYPTLSWRAVMTEVKNLKAGDYVGYDLAERAPKNMKMAILPVGYWHGFPRALSAGGEVLVRGRRAHVLGRVSMDLLAVGLAGNAKPGDVVTLIGRDGREELLAEEQARHAGTIHYEFLTRLNPLMERIVI